MKKSLCFAAVGFVVLACLPASAKVLVYEPFDYPDAPLNGNGGARGTTGTWTTNDTGEDYRGNLIEASGNAGRSWQQVSAVNTATAPMPERRSE